MVTALLLHKVFKKAVKSVLQKVNISNMSSLNLPDTRSLSVFLCANDTFLSDWSWQILLIYQICPVVAKELSDPEKQFPAEPMLFVVSPLNLLIADQINSCKRMAINACKVDMEMTGVLFADKAHAPYKTNHVFPCFSMFLWSLRKTFYGSFWRAGKTRQSLDCIFKG